MDWVLFLLLGLPAIVLSQTQECPTGWTNIQNMCYKFSSYPKFKIAGAIAACRQDSATLVSVNTLTEYVYLKQHLETEIGNEDVWLTSGVVRKDPEGIEWLGDGTLVFNLNNQWQDNYPAQERTSGDPVVFAYRSGAYGWGIGDPGQNMSFICEIALSSVDSVVAEDRDFDYGMDITNPALAPRGPKFETEPETTTILNKITQTSLNCLASGNPRPVYQWLKSSRLDGTYVPVDLSSPSYSMTEGKLNLDDVQSKDTGWYMCNATNQFGTVLSPPVSLSFGNLGYFSNVGSSTVTGSLSKGAVLQCPTITAKPGVKYTWHKQKTPMSSVVFIRPEAQSHIFISNNGRLYFSELAPSDDDTYYCSVYLSTMSAQGNYEGSSQAEGRTSIGFRLEVDTGVSDDYHPEIQDDFIKVYPNNPKRGQDIELECFAYGTAVLRYSWRRTGKGLPSRVTYRSANRILIIKDVQIEDSGQYTCTVYSSRTKRSDAKNFTLNIKSEPYFSYDLQNQHLDVGSTLSWYCEARGKPNPTYTWLKNGRVIANNSDITASGNTLTIKNVNKARDDGMYQCSAQNIYGIKRSSAQIRVLEFKPSFLKHPLLSSLSAAIGGNITIVCDPEAAPAPVYQWLRNGNDIGVSKENPVSGSFTMLPNGNLVITGVTNSHQGRYTCKVTNTMGEAESSGDLRVYNNIVISQPPKNEFELVNETALMTCQASTPVGVDVVYIWLFNDHPIDFTRLVEYTMGTGVTTKGSLYIVGVQYKHEGKYTCQITTGMETKSASALLQVRGPPGEPAGVIQGDNTGPDSQPTDNEDRSVRLYWTDGFTHGGPILYYTVEFNTNFNSKWRPVPGAENVDSRTLASSEFPNKKTILLKNLKPYASHEFRVRAINQYGVGAPSLPSIKIQIKGAPPVSAPTGLTGGGGSVGDLRMRWDPLPEEDHNGPDLEYIIHWRERSTSSLQETVFQEQLLKPEDVCSHMSDIRLGLIHVCQFSKVVGKDNYFKPYETKVQAKNKYGEGKESDIVPIMSAEEMPVGTPRQVFAIPFNATALEVRWTPVKNDRTEMKGKLLGYRINYWNRDTEDEEQARFNIISVPPGEKNIDRGLVIGLVPGKWYIVNVQAFSSAGYGPKGEDFPQETANLAPALYPTEVHVHSIEGKGVRVSFRGISTKIGEEPLIGYKLQYWPNGDNIRKAMEKDVGRNNYGVITNLTSSILYQLRVFGYSIGGQGAQSSPAVYFTVGDGQIRINSETSEIMAGASLLQSSIVTVMSSLVISISVLYGLLRH